MEMRELVVGKSDIDKVADLMRYAAESGQNFEVTLRINPERKPSGASSNGVPEIFKPNPNGDDSSKFSDIEKLTAGYLIRLGFKANLLGYTYIKEAIQMICEDPTQMNNITKRLYPGIAKVYGSSAQKVERAIRHSIETAWGKGNVKLINELFGFVVDSEKGKPTNSEFLGLLYDYVIHDYNK